MIFLIVIIGIITLVLLALKKFNVSKKVILIIVITLLIVGIIIFLLDKFNIINKIKYSIYLNMPTITQEEKEQALARIELYEYDISVVDSYSIETYYIFYSQEKGYSYKKTSRTHTHWYSSEEKIYEERNLIKKKQLEKIIQNLDTKTPSHLSFYYKDLEIEKDELLNNLFSN